MPVEWFIEFAQALLKEKNVSVPDEAVQNQLTQDIASRARDYTLKSLISNLSTDEMTQLDSAIDNNDEAAAQAIMNTHQPVVTAAMADFRKTYLGAK